MAHRKNGNGRAKKPAGETLAAMERNVETKVATVAATVAKVAAASAKASTRSAAPASAPVQAAPVQPVAAEVPVQPEAAPVPSITAEAAAPAPAEAIVDTPINTSATAAPSAATAQKGADFSMNQINEQMQQQAQAAAEQFRSAFGDMNERTKSAMEKSAKLAEEMVDLTRGNVEAVVASTKAAARGVETLTQEAADYGRRSFEEASNTLKSFAEVRSATDFFKLQSDYARSAFEGYVAETAKMSEHVLKLAGDVAEPLTSRYAVAAERVKTVAA